MFWVIFAVAELLNKFWVGSELSLLGAHITHRNISNGVAHHFGHIQWAPFEDAFWNH